MIMMISLFGIGGLSILSSKSGLLASGHERFKGMAQAAAEAGIHATANWLVASVSLNNWSNYVSANNQTPYVPSAQQVFGNTIEPGQTGYPFFTTQGSEWYSVQILNNTDDPGYAAGNDDDGIVIIQSTGHGPAKAIAILEIKVQAPPLVSTPTGVPCVAYAQQNQSSAGAGRNDCLQINNFNTIVTCKPGVTC